MTGPADHQLPPEDDLLMMPTIQTGDASALLELEGSAREEVLLPADAHVIGEPVTVTQIHYPGLSRVGLLATCKRGERTYELSLADVVFPEASAGASFIAHELLHKVLALDLRHLDAHALLGERHLSSWPTLALRHFELGVAIGSLIVGEDFDGTLPWGYGDNRPFLRCLHGLSRALLRCDRREDAAAALRRLLRLDPADHLGAGAIAAAIEAGKTWRDLEMAP